MFAMFYGYNISFSIAALAIVAILLTVISIQYSSTNMVNKRYKFFLISAFVMIGLDVLTVYTNGVAKEMPIIVAQLLNGLYFFSGGMVAFLYLYYVISVAFVASKKETRKKLYLVNVIILGVFGASLVANNWLGFYYFIDPVNGYSHGPIYILVNLATIVYVVESLIIMVVKRSRFNIRQMISTILFYTSFFLSFALQLIWFNDTLLSDLGVALGALIVFFSIETPDYIKLMATLNELNELKASLEIQVQNRTHELDEEKKSYEELTLETLSSLASVIDAKDHYTNGHSFRVAAYSKGIAEQLGLSFQECEQIYFAGLIHDVGKIGINEAILTKPGKLDDKEYSVIKSHSVLGGDILKGIKEFPVFEHVARSHHERYDGGGYPDKLKGEEIPLQARIVTVADTFDAMTSNRSYRQALSDEAALNELIENKGTQFDPRVVKAFLDLYNLFDDSIRNHIDDLSKGIDTSKPLSETLK